LHASALDPQRALVIGNRGVGKSFWSSVLTHKETRDAISGDYPHLKLSSIHGVLGFHEDAGKDDGPAPSQAVLKALLDKNYEPEAIWRAVLIRALRDETGENIPSSLIDIAEWSASDIERSERALRHADSIFLQRKQTFLIVFDALDRLGRDWSTITPLTEGVLRFALDMRGFRALKAKVFMRTDQSKDDALFRFADSSKIRSDAVKLVWHRQDLFGLMYNHLLQNEEWKKALSRLSGVTISSRVFQNLLENEEIQETIFYRIAGEYMGAGAKRGRTYNWIYDHLGDAFGETSPRSFITAIQKAASFQPSPSETVIDHSGIRAGVQDASEVRVRQLKEDYDWIESVLEALNGLEVPCEPVMFVNRWKELGTVERVKEESETTFKLLPLELENPKISAEIALLMALANIGVVEFRDERRINMPDIFRVAAGIKRRGGVRPPSMRRN
jgi:hypothetical protein